MRQLYPDIKPYATHQLAVDNTHTLYIEEVGNPNGIPAVFLHGGPGAGCEPYHRRFFDPERYRMILFDQRGAGRSRPHADLTDNTTWHLVADMEQIREHFGIKKWLVFGGSWGSTLGLAYAESHPDKVLALLVRGIFLCRPHEIDWFYQQGASRIFPDYWQDFIAPIPVGQRADLPGAYHRILTGKDEIRRLAAAKAWATWEAHCLSLAGNPDAVKHLGDAHTALGLARIECHYFNNNSFLRPNQLLEDAHKLNGIPGVIVHGRYDVICPVENAWELSQTWPDGQLSILQKSGHAASEPEIIDVLVQATDFYAEKFAK